MNLVIAQRIWVFRTAKLALVGPERNVKFLFAERQKVNEPNGSTTTTNHFADQRPLVSNVDCHTQISPNQNVIAINTSSTHQMLMVGLSLSFSPSPPHFFYLFFNHFHSHITHIDIWHIQHRFSINMNELNRYRHVSGGAAFRYCNWLQCRYALQYSLSFSW